jgi:hypothetical protein
MASDDFSHSEPSSIRLQSILEIYLCPKTNRDPAAEPILVAAKKLGAKLRERKAFTNTATFALKCEVRVISPSLCTVQLDEFDAGVWGGPKGREGRPCTCTGNWACEVRRVLVGTWRTTDRCAF